MKVYAATKRGLHKKENEDRIVVNKTIISCGIFSAEIQGGIIGVADGVGGNYAGEKASHFVANRIGEANEITSDYLREINEELIRLSCTSHDLFEMATTLSCISINQNEAQLMNVGNSRVYSIIGGKYLKQMTADDTILNYLLCSGQLTEQEAISFDRKNEITACFGGGNPNLLKVSCRRISDVPPMFLISSDGLHDYLTLEEMEDIIAKSNLSEQVCVRLINEAISKGSQDDISVVIVAQ